MRTRQRIPGCTEALCPCGHSYARTRSRDYDTIWAWRVAVPGGTRCVDKCPKCGADLYETGETGEAQTPMLA